MIPVPYRREVAAKIRFPVVRSSISTPLPLRIASMEPSRLAVIAYTDVSWIAVQLPVSACQTRRPPSHDLAASHEPSGATVSDVTEGGAPSEGLSVLRRAPENGS